jgi:hypothetical protein
VIVGNAFFQRGFEEHDLLPGQWSVMPIVGTGSRLAHRASLLLISDEWESINHIKPASTRKTDQLNQQPASKPGKARRPTHPHSSLSIYFRACSCFSRQSDSAFKHATS